MGQQIAFIDSRIGGTNAFLETLPADARLITIDANADGIQQMAQSLARYSGLDAIHIVSHGSPGALLLGSSTIDSVRLQSQAATWQTIGRTLTEQGDILLYGCNVAEGTTGQAFVRELANLTGADVAASVDRSAPETEADEILEFSTGSVQAQTLVLPEAAGQLSANTAPALMLGGGRVTTSFGGNADWCNTVEVLDNGKLLVGGGGEYISGSDGRSSFALGRFNQDGSLDTSFHGDGQVTTDFDTRYSFGADFALGPEGKVVMVGSAEGSLALTRHNQDGSLDTSFDSDGKLVSSLEGFGAISVAIQSDGKIVIAGYLDDLNTSEWKRFFSLARFNADGSIDKSFGTDGQIVTDFNGSGSSIAYGVLIQEDGKIVAVGSARNAAGNANTYDTFAIARYHSDGSLDTSFDTDGKQSFGFGGFGSSAYSVNLNSDGTILVAGKATTDENSWLTSFGLAKLKSDGSLDTSFGQGGLATARFEGRVAGAYDSAIQTDGKIVLTGFAAVPETSLTKFAVSRFNTDG